VQRGKRLLAARHSVEKLDFGGHFFEATHSNGAKRGAANGQAGPIWDSWK
jgi:hypothetical protein